MEVERGLTEAGAERVMQALDRYPGIWGVLLDASEDFDGPGVAALRQAAGESIALLASFVSAGEESTEKRLTEHAVAAIALATVGNTAGGMTTYLIGRLVPERTRRRLDARALAWLGRYGSPATFFAWLPE